MILNWLKYIPGWPLVKLCKQLEYVFNVLNGIEGVNCRIDKPTHAKGYGWKVIFDGGTDITNGTDPIPTTWPDPPTVMGNGSLLYRFAPSRNASDPNTVDISEGSWIVLGFEVTADATGIGGPAAPYIVASIDYTFPSEMTIAAQASAPAAYEHRVKRLLAVLTYDGSTLSSILRCQIGNIVDTQLDHRFFPYVSADDPSVVLFTPGSWTRNGAKVTSSGSGTFGTPTNKYIIATINDAHAPTSLTISAVSEAPAATDRQTKRLIATLTYTGDNISQITRNQIEDIVDGELPDGDGDGDMLAWDNTDKAFKEVNAATDDALMIFEPAASHQNKVQWFNHGSVGQVLTSQSSGFSWDYAVEVDGSEDGTYYTLSDIQYDGTSHKIQKKINTHVVTDGIEAVTIGTSWIDVTTASECPEA